MTEEERFKQDIKKAFEEIREKNAERLSITIKNALPLLEKEEDVAFNYANMVIICYGCRSFIAYDGKIYALFYYIDWRLIYKSVNLSDIWPYFEEIESGAV